MFKSHKRSASVNKYYAYKKKIVSRFTDHKNNSTWSEEKKSKCYFKNTPKLFWN